MQKTIVALSIFVALIFVSVPFAAAEWQENMVTNNTLEEIYVIKSTWQAADDNKGIPAGFWTRGTYRIPPGKSRIFHSWDTNSIYFRISNAAGAIKANSGTTAFAFWAHPGRSFRVVSQTLDASVTTDQLLYSDRSPDQLVQLEGFVSYTGGSEVVVTQEWVLLDGQPTAPPNDELGDDGGRPGEDVAPPAWVASVITNATEADLYVVYATWKLENSKKGYPEGFRTRGTYRIRRGKGRVFHAWANNEIYFRIANAAGALKPEASSETFGFWLHPSRSFRLVSAQVSATVEQSGLSYSDRSTAKLERSDGFMVYESGSDVVVTADWVPVVPVDAGNNGNGNAGDDGTPTPPTSPVIPAAPAGMVLIPAGSLEITDSYHKKETDPGFQTRQERSLEITGTYEKTVSLDAFYMDKYEVTNAEYAAFLNAKGKHAEGGQIWFRIGYTDARIEFVAGVYRPISGYADYPVVEVSWYGAMAYAAWADKRLPTQAEWEYAARGGLTGKQYPWGDTIDKTKASYNNPVRDGSKAVGSYPPNGYGLYDMAGNVSEWCLDEYNGHIVGANLRAFHPGVRSWRVLRGGTWFYTERGMRVTFRHYFTEPSSVHFIGFRCVKDAPSAPANNDDNNDRNLQNQAPAKTTPVPDVAPPTPVVTPTLPPGMALIPAGTFKMGSTTGDADERPVHAVSLDAFYMDTHEVTNAQYAAFLNAKGKHADAGHTWLALGSSDTHIEQIDGRYSVNPGYENHPVVRVTWYGAMAYAAWAGKRLPTEAQWEYAARGGLAGKQYPWGDTIDTTQANYGWNTGDTTAGGAYAANGYGLYDMAGNVFEWCLDTYLDTFYATSPAQNPLSGDSTIIDAYTAVDSQRVLRGGSWFYPASVVRVSNRDYSFPMSTGNDLGFRCVKPAPP